MSTNGRLAGSELTTVQGRIQLSNLTARAWYAMKAAAAQAGVTLTIALPDGGYRDYATQVDMHVHPAAHGLNPNSSVPIAPAGYSTHGTGNRVDIAGGQAWALLHAAQFGFTREFGAADPNHYKHDGVTATATTGTVTNITQGDPDMPVVLSNIEPGFPKSGWTVTVFEFSWYHHVNSVEQGNDSRIWVDTRDTPPKPVNNTEFEWAIAQCEARKAAFIKALPTGGVPAVTVQIPDSFQAGVKQAAHDGAVEGAKTLKVTAG